LVFLVSIYAEPTPEAEKVSPGHLILFELEQAEPMVWLDEQRLLVCREEGKSWG